MAVSHVHSSPVADFTGTVTVYNSQGSSVTANATDLVQPSDWNSVHNQYVTIAGNTAGASTVSGTNVMLAGSGGVTLSVNGASIVISGSSEQPFSIWPWPPQAIATATQNSGTTGATGGSTQTTASYRIAPFPVPVDLQFHHVQCAASYATVAGTGSGIAAHMWGLYSLNQGTRYDSISTFQFCARLSQNSISAQTWTHYFGTNSTSNGGGFNGNSSVNMTGIKVFNVTTGDLSLAEGMYYLVYGFSMSSANANVLNWSNAVILSNSQSSLGGSFGVITTQTEGLPGLGVFSSTSNGTTAHLNCLPATIHTSCVTNTANLTQLYIPGNIMVHRTF